MNLLVVVACAAQVCAYSAIAGPMPIVQCMFMAQPMAARWEVLHPGVHIVDILCIAQGERLL